MNSSVVPDFFEHKIFSDSFLILILFIQMLGIIVNKQFDLYDN